MTAERVPLDGELELLGQISTASNATFAARIGHTPVVYKPIGGEQPLWDFPEVCLAHRELASFLVSQSVAENLVPPTTLRDGPFGFGMVQLWQDLAEVQPVQVVPAALRPKMGWRHVMDGYDETNSLVSVVHQDTDTLRLIAVLDVMCNNADRKGSHVLGLPDGQVRAIDHGLTFHPEPKLRTVLWGWIGEPLQTSEIAAIDRARQAVIADESGQFAELLGEEEIAAFIGRCDALVSDGVFPGPSGSMPAVPWPIM